MSTRFSTRHAIVAALVGLALSALGALRPAHAEALDHVVGVLAGEELPAGLGVAAVHLPPPLDHADVDPANVTVVWPEAPRIGRASARVTATVDGKVKHVWVPITIAALSPVEIATRDLAPGDVIADGDVRRELRATDPAARTAAPPDVIGARVTAAITAGEAVAPASIAPAVPVARGTEVKILVRRGNFTITGRGTLDRSARVGADVAAHLTNRTLVHGVLVDAATLEVSGDQP